jgi:hypothetical protein
LVSSSSCIRLKTTTTINTWIPDTYEDNLEKYRLFSQNLEQGVTSLEYIHYQNIKPKAKNIDLRYTCILHTLQLEYIESRLTTIAFASLLFLCTKQLYIKKPVYENNILQENLERQ